MTVSIQTNGGQMSVVAPYNCKFVAQAKNWGGRWNPPAWVFRPQEESRVRALCVDLYGEDGHGAVDTVTLRIEWTQSGSISQEPIMANGRTIARATGRDSGARMGESIILLSGGFSSGGSVKNWTTTVDAGTVVLVRDFPRACAENLVSKNNATNRRVYAIEAEAPTIDRDALQAERERLVARIAEIGLLIS